MNVRKQGNVESRGANRRLDEHRLREDLGHSERSDLSHAHREPATDVQGLVDRDTDGVRHVVLSAHDGGGLWVCGI